MIRKPAAFISTISDERGQELLYAGMRISDVFKEEIGIGGVLSLLWFKRRLPPYACKFIEMVLQLTADHGPAGEFFSFLFASIPSRSPVELTFPSPSSFFLI